MNTTRKLIHAKREVLQESAREIGMYIKIVDNENGSTEIELHHKKGFRIFSAYDETSSIYGFINGWNQCLIAERGAQND